jgi:hypothetical protein
LGDERREEKSVTEIMQWGVFYHSIKVQFILKLIKFTCIYRFHPELQK